ncbi:MAG: DUF6495 family protein [Chitinophagales bacterium]|nr:DUF6495 family protein [Chitinophagales bacterium]
MKYRKLRQEELEGLENDFITFLASNTVTASDWEKIKEDDPQKAESLIEVFSDIVFDKVLSDAKYLEYKTPNDIKTFHFLEDKIVMNGLFVEGNSSFDFTKDQQPEEMLKAVQMSGSKLKLYTAEKKYSRSPEMEAFEMLENGALISKDGHLFKLLEGLKS